MDVAWLVACHIAYAWLPQQENTCDTSCTGEGHPSDVISTGRIDATILPPSLPGRGTSADCVQ